MVRTHAVVLRKVDYGEADQVVTLLTQTGGKVAVIARGARKSAKRFGAGLQPFAITLVEYQPSRDATKLASLRSARLVKVCTRVLQSLERMQAAGAGLETVRQIMQADVEDAGVFRAVEDFLAAMDDGSFSPRLVLALFELRLWVALGYAPRLTTCITCGRAPREHQAVAYVPSMASIRCRACGGGTVIVPSAVRERVQNIHTEWQRILGEQWTAEQTHVLEEIAQALRHRVLPQHS